MDRKANIERLILESESPIKEVKFSAINGLADNAWHQIQGLQKVLVGYRRESRLLQDEALAQYKEKLLMDFYEIHKVEFETTNFLPATLKQLEVMDRIDKNGCYHFNGLQVQKADCNTCGRKNTCWGAEG